MRCRVRQRRGQTLIEAILALTVFSIAVGGSLTLAFRSFDALAHSRNLQDASVIAGEGFEAVQSIASASWGALVDGTYGLVRSGAPWAFQTNPDVVNGAYTRTIEVASVYRNATCAIVVGGGTLDPDAKHITVTVAWDEGGTRKEERFATIATNWRGASPGCTTTEAGSLTIDTSSACIGEEKKQLNDVVFRNTGTRDVTIDRLTIAWARPGGGSPGALRSVKIDGSDHWNGQANGPWSPYGVQPSGVELDLLDVSIPDGQIANGDRFRFDTKVNDMFFTISVRMADASTTTVSTESFVASCGGGS